MSKKRKIEFISPTKPALQVSNEPPKINWSLCFICQKNTDEKLQSSINITTGDPKQVYFELAQRIMTFKSHDVMPIEIDFPSLEDGCELGKSLYDHSAKHHKSCKLRFNSTKLNRVLKRTISQNDSSATPESFVLPQTRSSSK